MRFAVNIPLFGPFANPLEAMTLAREAEAAGWDGFFVWDHISFWGVPAADPWVTLAAVALNTQRLRIGATITPLPRRRPWKVARETVTLDHLSGGRLIFATGIGGGGDEWAELGEETDEKARAAMLDEGLGLLTTLWQGGALNHQGTFYTVQVKSFLPQPVQQPRIPIWIAGMWPNKAPFRRAARWDGVYPIPRDNPLDTVLTPQDYRDILAYVHQHRASEAPFDVVHGGISPADPAQAGTAVRPYAEAGVTWWQESVSPWAFGWRGENDPWPLEAMRARVLAGPPRL
jgi:alkanesulfonate monooxygenase SsuD/methylene tetrahydromethanopterin reductase-like flavin-dependent oxidoreductase (luciferase family)